MITDLALLRLMQLVSPGLPIGAYSYSQGLEGAVQEGLINNAEETAHWLSGMLENCLAYVDVPLAARLFDAWQIRDEDAIAEYNAMLLANRETAELRNEDRHTGQALARLLADMDIAYARDWQRHPQATLANLFMLAAVTWQIPKCSALLGYLWSWLENQVLCAVKLVPLGQVAGQRLQAQLAASLPDILNTGLALQRDDIGGSAFGLALISSRHEMQYSRLFRS